MGFRIINNDIKKMLMCLKAIYRHNGRQIELPGDDCVFFIGQSCLESTK
jgi:hypothetical protein